MTARKKRGAKKKPAAKRPVGRPTKYRPEYCEKLIKHMAGGLSYETFCASLYRESNGEIQISRRALYEWEKQHPEFMHAKEVGIEVGQEFWESMGRAGCGGQLKRLDEERTKIDGRVIKKYAQATFAQTAWSITMKNRFGWRNSHEVTGKIEVETKTKTERVLKDPKLRAAAQLIAEATLDDEFD